MEHTHAYINIYMYLCVLSFLNTKMMQVNPYSGTTKTHLSFIVNTIVANGLVMQKASVSTALVLRIFRLQCQNGKCC